MPSKRAPVVVTLLTALTALAGSGCIDLEVKHEIKDLRILGVRLDPPEIVYSPFLAFPAAQRPPIPVPPVEVRATILAADPRAEEPVTFVTHLCPESNNSACRNYEIPEFSEEQEHDPAQLRQVLEDFTTLRAATIAPQDGLLVGSLGSFAVPERAVEYILPHGPDGAASILFEDYARVIVEAEHLAVREVAFRRLPFNANFDFSTLPPPLDQQLADQFSEFLGVSICDAQQNQEEKPDCLKSRVTNRNPTIEEMRFSRETLVRPEYDDDGEDTREFGEVVSGPISLAPGEDLNLWPVFARGDLEPYQIWEVDLQAAKLMLANYKEQIATSWYVDRGNLHPPLSPPVITDDTSTVYTYPDIDPPESVTVYVVVRDQRGGVDWTTVEIVRD